MIFPEGEERGKVEERIFEEKVSENIPNLIKYMNLHIQEFLNNLQGG